VPDTPTTRLGLYKSLADGSELVDYSQDIGQNLDKLDLAAGFQVVTSSTRPSSPYSGKPIAESDTSYRTYFSNGTSPASASWVEIPNSSATYNSNLKLGATKQINFGASGSSACVATLTSAVGDDILSTRITGDTASRFLLEADGTQGWGPGGSTSPDTTLARTATGRLTLSGTNAALTIGSATYRNALSSGPTTVANTTSETVIATATIPAGDAVAGAVYRMIAYGVASTTGTPNFSMGSRLGGLAGTSMGGIGGSTTASGLSGRPWKAEYYLRCVSTGASAVWSPFFVVQHSLISGVQVGSVQHPNAIPNQTVDSTVSQAMVITWTWSAASSSNTATCTAVVFERVA
jgi:hypothetical protein